MRSCRKNNPWIRLSVVLLMLGFVALSGPGVAQRLDAVHFEQGAAGSGGERQVIGPGKVRLTQTRNGRWLEFSPEWTSGRSLIAGGGFVVYAADIDGTPTQVVSTASDNLRVRKVVRSHEGAVGGSRSPSPNPDDDGDGRFDEDRLDGVDNDNDGAVDEDFAAIGDEMLVTEYLAIGTGASSNLLFHQESYAWSLPHIDGTVMVSLRIKNAGAKPMQDVRVAAFLDKPGPFTFTERNVDAAARGADQPGLARALFASETSGSAVGMILFPRVGEWESPWLTGHARLDKLSDAISEQIAGHDRVLEDSAPFALMGPPPAPVAGVMEEAPIDDGAAIYAISPSTDRLEPGEEIRIDLAIIAVPLTAKIDATAETALKTYLGDGVNYYIPPPLSMTPRVIWGTYQAAEGETPGLRVNFEDLSEAPVTPKQVAYFSGVNEGQVERRDTPADGFELILHGDAVEQMLRKGDRVTLKGRLDTGEFFEALLRPGRQDGEPRATSSHDVEIFWKTQGKLQPSLLKGSPNPFRDATTIFYEVPSAIEQDDGTVLRTEGPYETSVKVYNVAGRLVSVLADEQAMPGTYSTPWLAVDENGSPVASGVYYVKLQIERRYITKRIILLK